MIFDLEQIELSKIAGLVSTGPNIGIRIGADRDPALNAGVIRTGDSLIARTEGNAMIHFVLYVHTAFRNIQHHGRIACGNVEGRADNRDRSMLCENAERILLRTDLKAGAAVFKVQQFAVATEFL
jgi:hypothetical protein